MSLTRFILPGLMLGLVLSLTPSVAKAGVVFGNLGSNGDSPTVAGVDSVNVSTAARYGAFGFNTGAATFGSLELKSVTFALSGAAPPAANVEIWSSTGVGGAATPSSILTGAVASTVTPPGLGSNLYTFTFNGSGSNFGPEGGYKLSPSTDYWVVLKGATGLFWDQQSNQATPTDNLNGSTYTAIFPGNYVRASSTSGGSWTTSSVQSAGFSINAVPEPSTYVMAGIGAGLAGLAQLRRRKR